MAFGVPLYISEGENEMSIFNLACEFCRLHSYNGWREHTHGLYLLRGGIDRSEYLIFGLMEVPELPQALHKITGLYWLTTDRVKVFLQYATSTARTTVTLF